MLASILAPALLLLASANAQDTTEGIMTIQTSVPGTLVGTSTTTPCFEVCVDDPCFPCGRDTTAVPSIITDPLITSGLSITGEMSIPPGETPLPSSLITESPITTGLTGSAPASSGESSGSAPSSGGTSASGSAPPSESTGAAAPGLNGDGSPYMVAMAVSGLSALFGVAWTLL